MKVNYGWEKMHLSIQVSVESQSVILAVFLVVLDQTARLEP